MIKGLVGFVLGIALMVGAQFIDAQERHELVKHRKFTCPIEMDIREVSGQIVQDAMKKPRCVRA